MWATCVRRSSTSAWPSLWQWISLAVPHGAERLRAYQTHIGLDAQRFAAFMGRWDEVAMMAARTLTIARGCPSR